MTSDQKELVVTMLGHLPNISAVARLVGLSPITVYREKKKDPEFAANVDEVMEVGYDGLEEEAIRRAKDGILKPVFFQGEECGTIREYSDSLLKELLRAYRPKKFNPGTKVDLNTREGVTLNFNFGRD